VSLIGSAAVQFSLIWWLASETGSPIMMSIAGVFAFLPQLILGPFVGVWVDRLSRKTVIIAADLFIGLSALAFSLFFLFDSPPYWSVCVVLGIRAVGNVFHSPAIQAAVPMLVPQQELVRANGWSQFMQSGAFLLGPVLGAAMYATLPLWTILLSDLAGALVASATVAIVKIPDPKRHTQQRPHFFFEMKEGAAAIWQDKRLFIVTAATQPQFSNYAFGIAHSRPNCRKQGCAVVVFCFRERAPDTYAG
jgi:DHA3 family macrolide efflux protein-like MFS transporter